MTRLYLSGTYIASVIQGLWVSGLRALVQKVHPIRRAADDTWVQRRWRKRQASSRRSQLGPVWGIQALCSSTTAVQAGWRLELTLQGLQKAAPLRPTV
jgi:hypothetical protein